MLLALLFALEALMGGKLAIRILVCRTVLHAELGFCRAR